MLHLIYFERILCFTQEWEMRRWTLIAHKNWFISLSIFNVRNNKKCRSRKHDFGQECVCACEFRTDVCYEKLDDKLFCVRKTFLPVPYRYWNFFDEDLFELVCFQNTVPYLRTYVFLNYRLLIYFSVRARLKSPSIAAKPFHEFILPSCLRR